MNKILFLLFLTLTLNLAAQDKRFTHNSENGFIWLDFEKRMIMNDMKYDFLSVMLDNQKLKKLSGNYKNDLSCDKEINKLQLKDNDKLDLHLMVNMIDKFYSNKTNLIVPINFAYCCCIKSLAGLNEKDLEKYLQELLTFSRGKSEQ